MDDKNISIIVPIAQTKEVLNLFIDSLFRTVKLRCTLYLINDASESTSKIYLSQIQSDHPKNFKVILKNHDISKGSVYSINEALCLVEKNHDVILLDSDLILENGWLEALMNVSNTENLVGVVSGVLLYPQTNGVQHAGIGFSDDIGRHLFLNAKYEQIANKIYEVQTACFAMFYIKSEVLNTVGLLDEEFFNGYEDFDFSFRIKKLGFKIFINTNAKAYHWEKSSGIHRNDNRKRNLGRFWKKNGSLVQNDIFDFLESNIKESIKNITSFRIVDLCSDRVDALRMKNSLEKNLNFEFIDFQNLSTLCKKEENIWIPTILGTESFYTVHPYLFLTDNFVSMINNAYWLERREKMCQDDYILDLHGNCIRFLDLFSSSWPGSKTR